VNFKPGKRPISEKKSVVVEDRAANNFRVCCRWCKRGRECGRMSAVLGRPSLALHQLLSANITFKRHSVSPLHARHVHPIRTRRPIRLLCSLDSNATTTTAAAAALPTNDLNALVPGGKHLLTDQVYSYILRHTREPQVLPLYPTLISLRKFFHSLCGASWTAIAHSWGFHLNSLLSSNWVPCQCQRCENWQFSSWAKVFCNAQILQELREEMAASPGSNMQVSECVSSWFLPGKGGLQPGESCRSSGFRV
jgi:hypothetical protein